MSEAKKLEHYGQKVLELFEDKRDKNCPSYSHAIAMAMDRISDEFSEQQIRAVSGLLSIGFNYSMNMIKEMVGEEEFEKKITEWHDNPDNPKMVMYYSILTARPREKMYQDIKHGK